MDRKASADGSSLRHCVPAVLPPWLMAQATRQTDPRYSSPPPSPSLVVAYNNLEELDRLTQTEEEEGEVEEEEEEDNSSLETSLLLLDTLTQDDSVAGYDPDMDNGERWQANAFRKAALDSGQCSHSPRTGPFGSPLLDTPTQEDRPSLLLAPTQIDLLNVSTQMDPTASGVLSFTEGESLDSLPTQTDGFALEEWRCSGTQTDDHPTEIDIAHPALTALRAKGPSRVKKGLTEGRTPPLVDTLEYEQTPPETEEGSSGTHARPRPIVPDCLKFANMFCIILSLWGTDHAKEEEDGRRRHAERTLAACQKENPRRGRRTGSGEEKGTASLSCKEQARRRCVSPRASPKTRLRSLPLLLFTVASRHVDGDQDIAKASRARRGHSERWSRSMANSRACWSPEQVCRCRSH